MAGARQRVAVLLGGRSPEHDVSVVSGLQALQALDATRYEGFPVYIATDGAWFTGPELRERSAYLPDAGAREKLVQILAPVRCADGGLAFQGLRKGFFSRETRIPFDVVLPVLHGGSGEDGGVQGFLETLGVPYAGMRLRACAIAMNKIATKRLAAAVGVPVLPFVELRRPRQGLLLPRAVLAAALEKIGLPAIVKPVNLGSSIGVARITALEELEAVLPGIFRMDVAAMLEPCVPNLVEYNLAVGALAAEGGVRTSAIEQPKCSAELLDFRQKYLAGGGGKTGSKLPGATPSEGMLSLTRTLNPALRPGQEETLRRSAATLFEALDGTGSPRLDFLCNGGTGELWFNEINTCPGSLAYFLWEAAKPPVLFTAFLTALLEEAMACARATSLPDDPVPADARLFPRSV